jgi:transmembrane protein 18
MVRGLKAQLRDAQKRQDLQTLVREFINAIDWSEWWIRAILGIHLILLLLVVVFHSTMSVQLSVFMFCVAIIVLAQPLNSLGAEYWEEFAKEPYFDKRGAFYSGVISSPLVIIMMLVLVNMVRSTIADMVKLKRQELRRHLRQSSDEDDHIKDE